MSLRISSQVKRGRREVLSPCLCETCLGVFVNFAGDNFHLDFGGVSMKSGIRP